MRTPCPALLLLLAFTFVLILQCAVAQTVIATVETGSIPVALAINSTTNKIYVVNQNSNNVTVIDGATNGTAVVTVGQSPAALAVNPVTNKIYIANAGDNTVTVIDGATYSTVTVNIGNSPLAVAVNTTDVVLDINGYFMPAALSTLAFYPLQPCRVVDTRWSNGPLGGPFLQGGVPRDFPVTASACTIPASAQAYSLNFTAIPRGPLGYLATWPAGQNQPGVSTLNALTGVITANAAIVPAGSGGDIDVLVSSDSDVVIDINGYFAPAAPAGLSLYPTAPCRVLDTRKTTGLFSGAIGVNVAGSPCGVPGVARAFVLNATVVPQGALGYLTLWPDGQSQPAVSTLNAIDGAVTSNMAIVPTTNGFIDAFASNPTQLVLDSSSYFGP